MKLLSLITAATALLFLGACERHTWEDVDSNGDGQIDVNEKGTKRLYKDDGHAGEKHAKGGGGEGESLEPKEAH